MKCKQLMSCCQKTQVSRRVPYFQVPRFIHKVHIQVPYVMIEMAKSNQAKAKRKLEAVREKQKEVDSQTIRSCWRKHYQLMFQLYHQRKESKSKCELSFYTSLQVLSPAQ